MRAFASIKLDEASSRDQGQHWIADLAGRDSDVGVDLGNASVSQELLWVVGRPLEATVAHVDAAASRRKAVQEYLTLGERPVFSLWLVPSERLSQWLAVNAAGSGLIEERIGAATREMLAKACERYDGLYRVTYSEEWGRPLVQALVVAHPGARPLSKGLLPDLEAVWDRALHRAFGMAAPIRNARVVPGDESKEQLLRKWWDEHNDYREAVFQRYRDVSGDGAWRTSWSTAMRAELDYFASWGRYERAPFGIRTEYPETRIDLGGGARCLNGLGAEQRREVLLAALHEVLPRQQLYIMHAGPTEKGGADLRLVVHHFVSLNAGERLRLTERLPAAVSELAREAAPDRGDWVVGPAQLRSAYTAPQKSFDLLARAMPPSMARSLGRGLDRIERFGRMS